MPFDIKDIEKAREIVKLEERAKAAALELSNVSSSLTSMGLDIRISGWDWNKAGSIASIIPTNRVHVDIVDLDTRGK